MAVACHPGWTGTNLQHRATGLVRVPLLQVWPWFAASLDRPQVDLTLPLRCDGAYLCAIDADGQHAELVRSDIDDGPECGVRTAAKPRRAAPAVRRHPSLRCRQRKRRLEGW